MAAAWPWAPELRRCPWAVLTPEDFAMHAWWESWKLLGSLPWGSQNVADEPAFVGEALLVCESTARAIEAERRRDLEAQLEAERKGARNAT